MRLKTLQVWKNLAAILIIFSCASLPGCSGAGKPTTHPRATTPTNYGPVQVSGRAPRPTDIRAGGIDVTSQAKEISFDFGPHGSDSIVIPYNDWNTVTGTSRVPIDVGLMLDPGYNADDTMRNRFQYLADRIALFKPSVFNVIGVNSNPAYGKYMATIAIDNPTDQITRISNLRIKISSQSPKMLVASRTFYNLTHGGCIVPAHTVYFAYLGFAPSSAASNGLSFDFSYGTSICPGEVCHTGIPITLCQE